MLLEIDTHSGIPIYRQIIDQIRRHIMTGNLPPGAQLPAVRELATNLKVNPMTISKAYSMLETTGMVERRRGIGLFASEIADNEATQTKTEILSEQLKTAAVTAVQLGIGKDQAIELFSEFYGSYNGKERSIS